MLDLHSYKDLNQFEYIILVSCFASSISKFDSGVIPKSSFAYARSNEGSK